MSKTDTKALFDAYQTADDLVEKLRKDLETAIANRSNAVQAIVKAKGVGPFQWKGEVLKATKRDSKDESGKVIGTTHFFKSMGSEVEQIG